jgi:hypothetical protein
VLELISRLAPLAQWLVMIFAAWICWSLRQMAKNAIDAVAAKLTRVDEGLAEKIADHEGRLNTHTGQIINIKENISELPKMSDFTRLEAEVRGVGREISNVGDATRRIEGFFLQRGVEKA